MSRLLKILIAAAPLLGGVLTPVAAATLTVLPVEFRAVHQGDTWVNRQSVGGMPLSTTPGNPPGSNGQLPAGNESTGVFTPPTPGQFRGFMSFGAAPGLREADWQVVSNSAVLNAGTTAFSGAVAEQMQLPRASADGRVLMVLRRGQVGAPFLSRQVSFSFGSVVAPPEKDEQGALLRGIPPAVYWLPEPFSTNAHQGESYYWSPHSRRVFTIQAGPLAVTWRRAEPVSTEHPAPPNYSNPNGPLSFVTNGANVFVLYTERYLVSGTAAQPPRKMHWTQKSFQKSGVPVRVPQARVGAINIVYNNNFPRTVPDEFSGVGASNPTDGTTNAPLPELRTLWFEQAGQQGSLYAYNVEGRVFLELLGDPRPDGETYQVLGTEIVDVTKQAVPSDVEVELGERIVPPENAPLEELFPEPFPQTVAGDFAFRHSVDGAPKPAFYAVRETGNLNDYLVHWLEAGEAGLLWPKLLGRYRMVWPRDVSRYSHYVRPPATTDLEAAATAVPLAQENAPVIEYQDPLDRPRARFTSDFKFYSWLDAEYPVHRTLLRYTSGEAIGFERVFSWLDSSLRNTNFAGSAISAVARGILTNLTAWNPDEDRFDWPEELKLHAPRVVHAPAEVGRRIDPPAAVDDDPADGFLAGHLNLAVGTSFNVAAYRDPLQAGFAAADQGAIIPVNQIPGNDTLEVWWFRPNGPHAGLNAGNALLGFLPTRWPTVIGRYHLEWPAEPREIVLASQLGGQGLTTAEQLGSIYFQNDLSQAGYNPNEEHAIMSGGTPFATRDDLNITTPDPAVYSSEPYVLVDYLHPDGRPAMAAFKVLRERPDLGFVFDYVVPAGQMLQPPPPLNFLGRPVEGSGDSAINYNAEPAGGQGDLPGGWTTDAATGPYGHYQRFTYRDRKENFWVYRGPHAGIPELAAGTYDVPSRTFHPLTNATAIVGEPFRFALHTSRQAENLTLSVSGAPAWLGLIGLTLQGTPQVSDLATSEVELVVRDRYDGAQVTNRLTVTVSSGGLAAGQSPLSLRSTNAHTGSVTTFTNRPPFLALSPGGSNSFTMRFYYRTEPSFAWPGLPAPPPGSIVPYLRPTDPATGRFRGEAGSPNTESLGIVYRPFWPAADPQDSSKPMPTLPYGGTLAEPAFNLPGVRSFKTAHILYQQSVAANLNAPAVSAVLHDPTRAKVVDITEQFDERIPASVQTEAHQGKIYFPQLPPHLAQRVYLDPNRGPRGSLVLVGQYRKELVGESYLHLNVLRGTDLAAVHNLCPPADSANHGRWVALVNSLDTAVETFREDLPVRPGTYVPDPARATVVGVQDLAVVDSDQVAVDSYALSATGPGRGYVIVVESGGTAFTQPGDPVALHLFRVGGGLHPGELKVLPSGNPLSELITFQHSADLAGRHAEYEYEWKIAAPVDGLPPEPDATMSRYQSLTPAVADLPRVTLGGAGIQALSDNYLVMRYRPLSTNHPLYQASPSHTDWSAWTRPMLAEGWIKRVLAGINPFNQRLTDLFNNQVNTDVSVITQAGRRRWEGDIALNLDTINNYGLIEIYETVLRRGRSLTIESGFNYGPANDALLLAAGYLSDLYLFLGNEAWADAANPTIGIGTADSNHGDIATALFAFRGQVPTLLEEELAMLRGRDDFLLPGINLRPVYNRLVWNYTRGINAGEVIYALNYNIQENPTQTSDGVIGADDAARMFPQGHGDAYGHYLTALKGYYSLLMNSRFDWVPRIEAVNVLGQAVSVDYLDERKFAAAAAAVARTGRQIFDLTWRQNYQPVGEAGWVHFAASRTNSRRSYVNATDGTTNQPVRHWGLDHWASRTGQGAYLHWVVGNAILPHEDPIPSHEEIQKVDRTTVPELQELATVASGLQTALDNAEGGLSPLGIPEGGLVFDLNPTRILGQEGGTHFEQVYQRATASLNNAVVAFDDAKDVTRLLRSEQDTLAEFQASVAREELAYTTALIELYGTPYPDDQGPGKLYRQDYAGPDLVHYAYVDLPELEFPDVGNYSNTNRWDFSLVDLPDDWETRQYRTLTADGKSIFNEVESITFQIGPHGFAEKPAAWTSHRRSPGRLQQAISEQILAHQKLRQVMNDTAGYFQTLPQMINLFEADNAVFAQIRDRQQNLLIADEVLEKVKFANDLFQKYQDSIQYDIVQSANLVAEGIPTSFIAGVAAGGDLTSAARSVIETAGFVTTSSLDKIALARYTVVAALELATSTARRWSQYSYIEPLERERELIQSVNDLGNQIYEMQSLLWTVNQQLREYDDTQRAVRALVAEGDRIQIEREMFRKRAAAVVQGYRTRDAAFRIFRNEKLERYKALFDLSARYALLAANAYDYETGLLGTPAGHDFKRRIIAARALGVVADGQPQYAGSNTGDPGLSSALAELHADWSVIRDRLGFNRPDVHSTTVSLRTEKERLLPGADGDTDWADLLLRARRADLLADADVRRLCMQVNAGDGLPVPGIIIPFSTTIAEGLNLFGLPLAAGDHNFSPSSFATKIAGVGVAFEGYRGMADPLSNSGAVSSAGGDAVPDPRSSFLDPDALAATPYIYLIPVGQDSLRSPPLGDASQIRTWSVEDLALPMPFNIGGATFPFRDTYQSADSLTEPLFALRKHAAFRPVSDPAKFALVFYNDSLPRNEFINTRLIGRSVWNSQWKLVIPGRSLLNNPDEGLDRFIRTVKDIKINFTTYSYSGN